VYGDTQRLGRLQISALEGGCCPTDSRCGSRAAFFVVRRHLGRAQHCYLMPGDREARKFKSWKMQCAKAASAPRKADLE
jgi:hypothetical protein